MPTALLTSPPICAILELASIAQRRRSYVCIIRYPDVGGRCGSGRLRAGLRDRLHPRRHRREKGAAASERHLVDPVRHQHGDRGVRHRGRRAAGHPLHAHPTGDVTWTTASSCAC